MVPGSKVGVACALCPWMYSEAHFVVTFHFGPGIFAEAWMVALALCSVTSIGVFHIFSAYYEIDEERRNIMKLRPSPRLTSDPEQLCCGI